MNTRPNPNDLYLIEIEARRLRAEAVREMFSALGRAVSGLVRTISAQFAGGRHGRAA